MANIVDEIEGANEPDVPAVPVPPAEPEPVADPVLVQEPEAEPEGRTGDPTTSTMVSPQQQELELLKKSQGLENNVSEFAADEDYEDELDSIKQAAGLSKERTNEYKKREE